MCCDLHCLCQSVQPTQAHVPDLDLDQSLTFEELQLRLTGRGLPFTIVHCHNAPKRRKLFSTHPQLSQMTIEIDMRI